MSDRMRLGLIITSMAFLAFGLWVGAWAEVNGIAAPYADAIRLTGGMGGCLAILAAIVAPPTLPGE